MANFTSEINAKTLKNFTGEVAKAIRDCNATIKPNKT